LARRPTSPFPTMLTTTRAFSVMTTDRTVAVPHVLAPGFRDCDSCSGPTSLSGLCGICAAMATLGLDSR
jgi:hypothetical protein